MVVAARVVVIIFVNVSGDSMFVTLPSRSCSSNKVSAGLARHKAECLCQRVQEGHSRKAWQSLEARTKAEPVPGRYSREDVFSALQNRRS